MAVDIKLVKFFVEGDADKVFVRDLIKLWYNITLTKEQLKELIVKCDGFTQIGKHLDEFKQTELNGKRAGGINIVLFDADIKGGGEYHGFDEKLKYLEGRRAELGVEFDIFLFPNNKDDGTLETLLESCICQEHKSIMDCWEGFETCVTEKGKYTIPANKSKIYVYLECLHGTSNSEKDKIKDPNRDFTLTDKWTIDETTNPYLSVLKGLLDKYLA